jgi:hypothetical protein
MKHVLTIFVFIAMLTAISMPAYSAEIYIWEDEQGVKHITEQPPEKPKKMIGKESYKPDSPEEIRRFQAQQNAVIQRGDAQDKADAQRRESNRAQGEAQNQRDRQQPQQQVQQQQQKAQDEITCFTQISGGAVFRICRDKNKKLISKDRI